MIKLKNKLRRREISIGSWLTIGSASVAEIMSRAGFDWLTIDMEHSAITLKECQEMARVIELCGTVPLVRVGENNPALIKRVMDCGAGGVIVPMVNTAFQAREAVAAVKYPPKGGRGVGLARAQGYGLNFESYKKWLDKESVVIVQIEHIEAVNNLEDILRVEGVDGFIVGPYDLSASLGIPGGFSRPEFKKALARIMKVTRNFGGSRGFHIVSPDTKAVLKKIREGYNFIGFSFDALFLGAGFKEDLSRIKKGMRK